MTSGVEAKLQERQRAYVNTFHGHVEFDIGRWALIRLALSCLVSKREIYRLTFCGAGNRPHPPGQAVLEDWRHQAGIDDGGIVVSPVTRVVDSHASVYRAGRRDMYLRAVRFLGLD